MNKFFNSDLTKQAPRSPRVRLGGFAHLARLIDKARASAYGKLGSYTYGNSSLLDFQFFKFTGLDPDTFLKKVSEGGGDFDILNWVLENTEKPLLDHEIQTWSNWIENVPGLSIEARAWFAEYSNQLIPSRPDITTLFEYLDVDDYVSFGGIA